MISASATMEQMISGQIGQPAACMIENNGVLFLRASGALNDARLWRAVACVPQAAMSPAVPLHPPFIHPPMLWTTLWATSKRGPQSREISSPALDCSKFRQGKTIENQ
jgi:hypothetical protein